MVFIQWSQYDIGWWLSEPFLYCSGECPTTFMAWDRHHSFSLTTFATPNSSSNSMPVYHRLRIRLNRYPTKSMVDVHKDVRKWSIIWRRSSDGPRCANRTPSFNICLWNPGMTLSKRSSSCLRTKHLAFAISTPAEWEIFEFHWMSSTNLSLRHGFYLDLKRHRQLSS